MTTDVLEQLEAYGAYADAVAPAISTDELDLRSSRISTRTPRRRLPGPAFAVAAAAVIAIAIGIAVAIRLHAPTPPPVVTTPPPTTTAPTTDARILPASEDPFVWQWDWFDHGTTGMPTVVNGTDCYGSADPPFQVSSAVLEFNGGSVDFALGLGSTPGVVVTDEDGTVTPVGNPFGEAAWLCSVAANDTHILAVGSGVSWSEDGVTWHGIDAFEQFVGNNIDGSNLMWAAAGPGGYMVLGRQRVVWFSEDLETWQETHLPNDYGTPWSNWGWVGPTSISIEEGEIVIDINGDRLVGTRP